MKKEKKLFAYTGEASVEDLEKELQIVTIAISLLKKSLSFIALFCYAWMCWIFVFLGAPFVTVWTITILLIFVFLFLVIINTIFYGKKVERILSEELDKRENENGL